MSSITKDERFELLEMIASESLGITSLAATGKLTADFRVIGVENLARALESAYDLGLVTGYRLGSGVESSEAGLAA
ncbi:hypothetical protein AWB81_04346 [Caballeronia arationis]|jgi:hypothetical protein|uniref:DUF6900 domain-containing protein n=1 Tax=Caballeronia arationis TaxID=1777142 RepID=A0A7Z7I5Z3_9BURK|nr:hypothetical protein [Caballeronia arationis]SAK85231.1 hypothetical protein AWB81_04346 [Caballeronia arationis]SOE66374.1 hypothetical protein SAMN05446927_3061 [Caballeronia arationis]